MFSARLFVYRSKGPTVLNNAHEGCVSCCTFSHDGLNLASSSYDQTILLWDVNTASRSLLLKGHDDWVTACSFSKDDNLLVSCSKDKTVKIWNLAGPRFIPVTVKTGDVVEDIKCCDACQREFKRPYCQQSEKEELCYFCQHEREATNNKKM